MNVALFDLDNTLFDRSAAFRTSMILFVEQRGFGPDALQWLLGADKDGFADRHQFWGEAAVHFSLSEPVGRLVEDHRRQYLDLLEPDPQVLVGLSELRRAGWKTCVVTNGPHPHQREKAERLDILGQVDGFCASGELGIAKPDRRIFLEALRRASGDTDEAAKRERWMVGDSPTSDIAGGRAVGLRTIWLHRGRTWNEEHGPPPDHTAGDISQAVSHILARN